MKLLIHYNFLGDAMVFVKVEVVKFIICKFLRTMVAKYLSCKQSLNYLWSLLSYFTE